MKIGVCSGVSGAAVVKRTGYDYLEENFARISGLTDEEFESVYNQYKSVGITVYATNGFMPNGISIYQPDALDIIEKHAKRGFERVSRLGVKVCVVGSGKQRMMGGLVSRKEAEIRFVEILKMIGDMAKEYGIRLAIEPLKFEETDFIHTVAEANELAVRSGRENVGSLVDFYHFYLNGEKDDGVECARGRLFHAHIARPNADRRMPSEAELPTLRKWAEMLKNVGYTGGISLEGNMGEDYEKTLRDTLPLMDCFKKI